MSSKFGSLVPGFQSPEFLSSHPDHLLQKWRPWFHPLSFSKEKFQLQINLEFMKVTEGIEQHHRTGAGGRQT